MKQTLIFAALMGGLAGAGGAGLTQVFSDSDKADSDQTLAVAPGGAVELESRMLSLQEQNRELRQRIEALETRPLLAGPDIREEIPTAVASEEQEFRAMVADLHAAIIEQPDPVAVPTLGAVRNAMETIREEEEAERDQRREESAERRLQERLDKLTEDLELAPYQRDGLYEVFSNEDQRRDAIVTEARESGDWGSMRDVFRDLRDETDDALSQVLSVEQLEKYEEDRGGRGWGGFGGGGGGGGGGRRGGDN